MLVVGASCRVYSKMFSIRGNEVGTLKEAAFFSNLEFSWFGCHMTYVVVGE